MIGRHGGPDILAENQGHAGLEAEQTAGGHGDGQADGGAAALYDHGDNGPDQDPQHGVVTNRKKELP